MASLTVILSETLKPPEGDIERRQYFFTSLSQSLLEQFTVLAHGTVLSEQVEKEVRILGWFDPKKSPNFKARAEPKQVYELQPLPERLLGEISRYMKMADKYSSLFYRWQ